MTWFLVLVMVGIAVVPEPFATKEACMTAVDNLKRNAEGQYSVAKGVEGFCVQGPRR